MKQKCGRSPSSATNSMPTTVDKQQLPPEGSLRYALVTNPYKYLWADPMAWHDGHLQVLNCPPPLITQASISQQGRDNNYDPIMVAHHSTLHQWKLPDSRNLRLREIMKSILAHKKTALHLEDLIEINKDGDLLLYYGRTLVATMKVEMIASKDGNIPLFVYLDSTWMRSRRFEFWHRNFPGKPKGLKMHFLTRQTVHSAIDPFFVAMMIAMAQALFYSSLRKRQRRRSFQVHLLCPSEDAQFMIRYSSDITTTYLMKFENPHQFYNARLEITRLDVPVSSLEMLGDLVEDIMSYNVPIQYHPPIVSFPETLPNRKRKSSANSVTAYPHGSSGTGTDGSGHKEKRRHVRIKDEDVLMRA